MFSDEMVQRFKESVNQSQSIFIFISTQAKYDQVASALVLAAGLQQLGKEVVLISPAAPKGNLEGLSGLERFVHQIGNKNLQVSFDYQPDMVDKVSYNIDEESHKFYLIIQPKKGTPPLDSNTVQFAHTGANVDLIITIGVTGLASLDGLYEAYESLFSESTIASVHAFETEYGSIKLNTSGFSTIAEGVAKLLPALGVAPTPEMASNLLAAIAMTSDDFRSSSMTADTFEVVAQLLRAGGHRLVMSKITPSLVAPEAHSVSMDVPRSNGFADAVQTTNRQQQNGAKKARKVLPPVSEMPPIEGGSRL